MSGEMSGLSGQIYRADCDISEVEGEMAGNNGRILMYEIGY
jgi:hypothetical protein